MSSIATSQLQSFQFDPQVTVHAVFLLFSICMGFLQPLKNIPGGGLAKLPLE